jgi:hypothetical protein
MEVGFCLTPFKVCLYCVAIFDPNYYSWCYLDAEKKDCVCSICMAEILMNLRKSEGNG